MHFFANEINAMITCTLGQILFSETYLMIGFGIAVLSMLIIDLGVFNKNPHKITNKEALIWTLIWVFMALAFSVFVWHYLGKENFSDYLSAYLIEKALSIDNLFVFVLIFSYFKVPAQYQHKVLFYGIIGAIISRAVFIFSGVWLINLVYLPPFELFGHVIHLNVLLVFFGIFLIYAGIKSAFRTEDSESDFSNNIVVRLIRKFLPVTEGYHGGSFMVRKEGRLMATPLLLVVAVIEATDILFAVDSIPAIFAISTDPFILYSSNIFAILGLRALYFLLANFISMFRFLNYGLAIILSFIGIKMLLADFYKIPSTVALLIVAGVLFFSVFLSVVIKSEKIQK